MVKFLTGARLRATGLALACLLAQACGGRDGDSGDLQIISIPVRNAVVAKTYQYHVQAEGGDDLKWSLKTCPEGMSINDETGEINWLPLYKQVGNHTVEVVVEDDESSASQVFAVRVIPDDSVPFQRGFTLVAWGTDPYLQPQTEVSLFNMAADGVEYVSILVTWYVTNASSYDLQPWAGVTASDTALLHAIATAKSLGLKVVLKPHVDCKDGAWRGEISFVAEEEWAIWFSNYNAFLGHYLDIAEASGVDMVFIGTELKQTESRGADWRKVIAQARTKFSGLLSYCANHDSFLFVTWWDALDFVGIDAYFKLTDSYTPTMDELLAAWAELNRNLRALSAYIEKDVVFTELGYQSRDGTNRCPYCLLSSDPDPQEQADCYQAALTTFYGNSWFKGFYWWAWSWDPSTDNDSFDIYNKPAELVLRQWYAGY